MLRKVQTRASSRQKYFHQNPPDINRITGNSVIRPPTSHPYSAYKNAKSESQLRGKYSNTYFLQSKIDNQLQQINKNFQICYHIDKLPPGLRHTMNKLRAAIKNIVNNGKVVDVEELVKSLARSMCEMIEEKKDAQRQKVENEERVKQLEEQIEKLQKQIQKCDTKENKNKWRKQKNSSYEQEIILQNCKLGEMNIKYLAKIAELQTKQESKAETLNQEKDPSNKFDTEILRCHNRISYLEIKLNSAEKTENDLITKLQQLEQQIKTLNRNNEDLKELNEEIRTKMNEWRERALMQKEDGEIQITRQQFLLYSLRKLRENNKNLLQKLLSQNTNNQKIGKKNLMQNTNFEYQMDFFKNLSSIYEQGKGQKIFSFDQVKKNQLGVEIEETMFDAQYQNYKKEDKYNVGTLKLYRPSFYAFLEESISTDLAQCRNKEGTSVSRIFIQILRGIMNSKLNEFLYVDSIEKFTRFPQFVYAWFQKFYFNSQKKCVLMLEPFMQKPISQETFYRDLMNVKLDQSWEIISFREFLLEELSLQELYFYSICQNLLYTRAGITKELQYTGDFNILVQYTAAKSVLDITLNDFQSWNITFLNSKLRQKLIIKNKKQMIEAGFFLRCLTEYYRIERSNRYRYISKLSSEFKDSKKGLRFSSFMSIINKFTQLPMQQKLKVYRDCFCITKGVITPQSIFTMCNENLIFLKYLKMKSFYRLPKIITRSLKIAQTLQNIGQQHLSFPDEISIHPSDPYIYSIILDFKKAIQEENSLVQRTETLGVSDLINQILYMMRALDERNTEINSNILKCKHFIHYFCDMLEKIRKITFMNFYELLEEQWKKRNKEFWVQISETQLGDIFAEQIKATFKTYHRINEIRIWKNKVYNFRTHHAASKIQKHVKRKFIEPYEQLYKFINHQSKNAQDQSSNGENMGSKLKN